MSPKFFLADSASLNILKTMLTLFEKIQNEVIAS